MNKAEIKVLIEANDKLQWWAATLFAEISELVEAEKNGQDRNACYSVIKSKVEEFPLLVIQNTIERAKERTTCPVALS